MGCIVLMNGLGVKDLTIFRSRWLGNQCSTIIFCVSFSSVKQDSNHTEHSTIQKGRILNLHGGEKLLTYLKIHGHRFSYQYLWVKYAQDHTTTQLPPSYGNSMSPTQQEYLFSPRYKHEATQLPTLHPHTAHSGTVYVIHPQAFLLQALNQYGS